MQITPRIHALKIPFEIHTPAGETLARWVYVYLLCGRQVHLVDTGVKAGAGMVCHALEEMGRSPADLGWMVFTHAHPDHIGAAAELKRLAPACRVAAHAADADWIADLARQQRDRPVPGFDHLVAGSVALDVRLADREMLELEPGMSLRVIHTPGHSPGHAALFFEPDGALFCGDTIPMPGGMPIYDDVPALIATLRKLRALADVQVLLSAWDEPRRGAEIGAAIDRGLHYVRQVHHRVIKQARLQPAAKPAELAAAVLKGLGLPDSACNPLTIRTIAAHWRAGRSIDLLAP